MVADGALLSYSETVTHHITPGEREGELSSTLPGCCVRVDGKRNIKGASKKEKKTANVVRGLRSSGKRPKEKKKKSKERDRERQGHESVNEFD